MKVRTLTLAALFTALISVLAPISIPLGLLPLTMQTLVIPLVASIASRRIAMLATVGYLLIGAAGLPVFAGWSGGLGTVFGPTGGYLLAMVVFPLVIGTALQYSRQWWIVISANLLAAMLQLLLGSSWLAWQANLTLHQGIMTGMVAFLLPMVIKVTLVFFLVTMFKRVMTLPIN